jgi:probable HAF family extracellular repeat protein
MQDIGTVGKEANSAAVSINNAGQVVGISSTTTEEYNRKTGFFYTRYTEHGFSWTSSSGMTGLGSYTYPTGINNSGEITGDTGAEASLWNGNKWIQLGILPGGTYSAALGINDYGQVVGYSANGNTNFFHGFLWTPSSPNSTSGSMIDLGTLFSTPGGGSWGSAVNSQGWVTGRSDDMNASGAGHAFVWVPSSTNGTAGSMIDLGTVAVNPSAGLSQSEGNAINGSGVVVGDANRAGATSQNQIVAVVWQPGTNGSYSISDLNNLIPSGTGWTLTRADAVNDQGQIVVETAQGHALLLTPATTRSARVRPAASVPTFASPNTAALRTAQMVTTGWLAFPSQAPTPGAMDGWNEPSPATTASSSSTPSSSTPPSTAAAGMRAPSQATPVDVVDQFFAQLETELSLNGWAKGRALSRRR